MTKGFPSVRRDRSAAAEMVAFFVVALFLVVAGGGSAQAAKRRVGIRLNGPHASAVHEVVAGVLKHHGFEATSADLTGETEEAVAQEARQGKLAAIIVGEVRDGGKRLKLRVYGSGGDLVGEGSWSEAGGIKKLEAALGRTLWTRIGGSLSKAHPGGGAAAAEKAEKPAKGPAPEAEEPSRKQGEEEPEQAPNTSRSKEGPEAAEGEKPRKRKKKPVKEEEEPEEPAGPAATALELAVGPRFLWRNLSWSPAVPIPNPYTLGHAPALGALIVWYPAAHFRGGWASNIGVATSIEYTPGLVSETSDGTRYPTNESDYWGGVRGRLVFGVAQASLTLGAGQQSFIFHSGTVPRDMLKSLPDVQYTYARAAVDLRVTLPANLSLMLGGGYRYVISAGDTGFLLQESTYFPNAKLSAYEVTAAAGYRFLSLLEARVGFDLRHYGMSAGANTYNVASASDQYVAAWGQLALLLEGYGAGEGGPAAAGKPAPNEKSDEGLQQKDDEDDDGK
jgi:hypothetical protein